MTTHKIKLLPIQETIWNDKYRFIAPERGVPRLTSDASVEDTWRRVAHALAVPEGNNAQFWEHHFYVVQENFQFLPAGRIIAGSGTLRDVTLFNCFVLGEVHDSMGGIFQRLRDGALTMQQGGGIGTDFSTLRPRNADVKGVGAKASGPVSFMDCWDAMCKTIMSAGARRGAMMGTLRCDHPDVEEFIDAKRDPLRLRNFNLSVLVTDKFMDAVKNGYNWPMQFNGKMYKTIDARYLWQKIMRSAYDYAEPGVIFVDRINKTNNLAYCETISSTNPCAEQPLPPNGACLLGSINLTAFVKNPFSDQCYFDAQGVERVTRVAVRAMDNVIDVSNYPLEEQRKEAHNKRRIGLGITGLADALIMCGLHYGSERACNTAALWMKTINEAAYHASMDLAVEKGPFPLFHPDMGQLYFERDCGAMRNGTLTSIAPTGTISLYAGNISSGIEPVFAWWTERKILMPDGTRKPFIVKDYAVHIFHKLHPGEPLPPQFYARHNELSPKQHLAMQAAVQPHVDSSISKTVNCPEDMTFEDFEALYLNAYKQGLKVCAAYRPNETTGSVLTAADDPDEPITGKVVVIETPYDPNALKSNGGAGGGGGVEIKHDGYDDPDGFVPSATAMEELARIGEGVVGKAPRGPRPIEYVALGEDGVLRDVDPDVAEKYIKQLDAFDSEEAQERMYSRHKFRQTMEALANGDLGEDPHTVIDKTLTDEQFAEMRAMIRDASGVDEPPGSFEVKADHHVDLSPGPIGHLLAPPPREKELQGKTYKIKWPPSEHALYITINNHPGEWDCEVVPYEIFINSKNPEHYAWSTALTRMISAIWRRGGDTSFVVEELKAVVDLRGGNWIDGKYVGSLQAYIGHIIDKHITPVNPVPTPEEIKSGPATGVIDAMAHMVHASTFFNKGMCPKCGSHNTCLPKKNCLECLDCNFSNCE